MTIYAIFFCWLSASHPEAISCKPFDGNSYDSAEKCKSRMSQYNLPTTKNGGVTMGLACMKKTIPARLKKLARLWKNCRPLLRREAHFFDGRERPGKPWMKSLGPSFSIQRLGPLC
jgi:hypothetical protein